MSRVSKGAKSIGLLLISTALGLCLVTAQGDACSPSYMFSQNERFGFGALGGITQFDVAQLHAGWYVNWGWTDNLSHIAGLEFMQIIRVGVDNQPSKNAIARVVEKNHGLTWLIGNEQDCCYGQDCRTPADYAQLYHEWYTFLKEKDPTCKVAIGGVVQATPLRLQYLDMILSSYQSLYGQKMPVDVWNVHNFILRERAGDWGCGIPPGIDASQGVLRQIGDHDRMDIFKSQIRSFRQWMKDKGERDKPLLVTEYGILMPNDYGFNDKRVQQFMINTFDYFTTATDSSLGYPADGNRLVQRWAWYSLNDANFYDHDCRSNLFNPHSKAISPLGQAYGNYTKPLVKPYVDLVPTDLSVKPSSPGNQIVAAPSRIYVWVDSGSVIGESCEDNNQAYKEISGEPTCMAFQATVTNQGNIDTPQAFTVSFWLGDPNDGGVLIAADQVDGVSGLWGSATTDLITVGSAELSLSSVSFNPPVPFSPSGQPATVTLQAAVANQGWLELNNVKVSFWSGDPQAGGTLLGSDTIPKIAAHSSEVAQFTWSNVKVGPHEVYVEVDPRDDFTECNEADNIGHKTLLVATSKGFLPLILKGHSSG